MKKEGVYFLLPLAGLLMFLLFIPCGMLIYISFTNWEIGNPFSSASFVGLQNYTRLVSEPRFWKDGLTTLLWIGGCIAIEFPLGLVIALVLKTAEQRSLSACKFFETLFLLPLAVAPIVTGVMWRFMYNGTYGVINYLLELVGLPRQDWLGSGLALLAVIITDIWEFTPLFVLLLFAALQTFPQQLEEAAKIDGATYLQRLVYVILPLIKPVIFVALVIRIIDLLRWIVTIFIMTAGGPGLRTEIWNILLYYMAFWQFSLDRASALAIFLIGVGAFFAFISMKAFFYRS